MRRCFFSLADFDCLYCLKKFHWLKSISTKRSKTREEKKEDENGNENEAAKEAKFLTHSELTLDFFRFIFWLLFCASTMLYGVQVLRSLSIEQWLSYRKEQIQGKTNCVTVINKSFFFKSCCWLLVSCNALLILLFTYIFAQE